MDNYLNSFREMISLRGLTDHTLKNYCTYIRAYLDYLSTHLPSSFSPSTTQQKAAYSISACKSGSLVCNISQCEDCRHVEIHNNSCRNRNCPNCQAILKEVWIDARKSEVIDNPCPRGIQSLCKA